MDLIAARNAINELIKIDEGIAAVEAATSEEEDGWIRELTRTEWLSILRARKAKAEDRLREVGIVAAHQPIARTFRDRPIDNAMQVGER